MTEPEPKVSGEWGTVPSLNPQEEERKENRAIWHGSLREADLFCFILFSWRVGESEITAHQQASKNLGSAFVSLQTSEGERYKSKN